MPRFEVELDDGRKFEFEADSQPSESEIMDAIGTRDKAVNAPQYEPEGMPEKDTRSVSVSSPIGVPWNVELPIDPSQSVAPIPRAEPKTQTGKVTLSSPIGVPMELDKDTMTKAGAALVNTAASVPNFMLSPVGTATMPIGGTALGKAAIQGVFAGLSAKGGAEALGEASVTGDTQKAMEGALMLGLAPTMATPSIHPKVAGALTPKPKPQWQGPIATGEILKRSAAVLPESTKAVIETLGPEEAAKISEAMTQRATAALENVEQVKPSEVSNAIEERIEPKSGVTEYQQVGEGRVSTTPSGSDSVKPEATVSNAAQGPERVLLDKEQSVKHLVGISGSVWDATERNWVHPSRESIIKAVEEAKASGVRIEHQTPSKPEFAETWRIYDDKGNQALLQRSPDGRTVWHGFKETPTFVAGKGGEPIGTGKEFPTGRTEVVGEPARKPEMLSGQRPIAENPNISKTPVEQPAPTQPAAAKVEQQMQRVANTEGTKQAKEVKSTLVSRIEEAQAKAPAAADLKTKPTSVTISIPKDGDFTIVNTKEALGQALKDAKQIDTKPNAENKIPLSHEKQTLGEQADAIVKAYGSPEAAYRSAKRQRDSLPSNDPDTPAQIERVDLLLNELYGKTKAGIAEFKADGARDQAAIYKQGAEGFRKDIARIQSLKKRTKAHNERLTDLQTRYAENQRRIGEYEATAERLEQEAAREKAALEAESSLPETGTTPQQAALPSTASEGSAKPGVSAPAPSAISNAKPIEQKTQAQEIVGMGGAVPGEFKPGQPMTSAIKNAAVDRDRVERGEKPMMDALRKHDSELWSQAMNVIDADWQAADKLIARYRAKPFIPTDVDTMVLLHRRVDLKNEYAKADRQYVEAAKEGLPTAEGYKATRDGVLAQLHELEAMLGKGDTAAGTMAGRAFRARQLVMNEDYSLASLVADREITLGRKLTDAEAAELRKIADEYKRLSAEQDALLSAHEKNAQALRERYIAEQAARDAAKANAPSDYVIKIAEDIVSSWDKRADAARARLKERMSRMSAGVDPTIIVDLAEIGLSHVGHVGLDFAKWSTRMLKDVGDWAKPHLEEAWKKTNEIANADIIARRGKAEASEVKRAISRPAIALDAVKSVTTALAKKVAKNKGYDLAWYARKLARHFWQQGIHEPQKLVDAVHGVLDKVIPELERRETMDALSGYGRYTQLTKDAVSVGLRDAYGQLQQIGKLEDMATGKAPLKSGFERRLPTDAERQLIKQVEEAKRKGGYDVTDPETQLRTAMQAAERRLTNQIADLEKEIKTRELIVKDKRKLVYDDKLNALKARRDALREQHDEIFKPGPMTEAERLALWKERTLERIEDYKERIAAGDVMPRKRPEPVKMDREALQIRYDLHKIHRALMDLRLKDQLKQRNFIQKAKDAVVNTITFSRAAMTGGEFSAVLRQGAPIVFSRPITGLKALGPMFKAFWSEKNQFKINEELQLRDNAQLYERAGLEFTEMGTRLSTMEEQYMFRVSERIRKIWGVNLGIKFLEKFQRAFTTYLNVLRADAFDAMVNAYGNDIGTAKAIANYINVANGRGSKAVGRFVGPSANAVFFAPRYTISRFQYLSGQPFWMASKGNRAMILKEYGRALAGAAVVYTIGKMAGGTIETDPRSPDFGKVKLGDTRIDPLAGLSQATRFLATEATGWRKNVKGQLLPVRDSNRMMPSTAWQKVKYGQPTGSDVAWNFVRSKLSPSVSAAISFAGGKDVAGKPFKLSDTLIAMSTPITYGDVLQAIEANGVEKGLALGTLAVFGMGVQTYTPTKGVPR